MDICDYLGERWIYPLQELEDIYLYGCTGNMSYMRIGRNCDLLGSVFFLSANTSAGYPHNPYTRTPSFCRIICSAKWGVSRVLPMKHCYSAGNNVTGSRALPVTGAIIRYRTAADPWAWTRCLRFSGAGRYSAEQCQTVQLW